VYPDPGLQLAGECTAFNDAVTCIVEGDSMVPGMDVEVADGHVRCGHLDGILRVLFNGIIGQGHAKEVPPSVKYHVGGNYHDSKVIGRTSGPVPGQRKFVPVQGNDRFVDLHREHRSIDVIPGSGAGEKRKEENSQGDSPPNAPRYGAIL